MTIDKMGLDRSFSGKKTRVNHGLHLTYNSKKPALYPN
jgi:hypothetical protein